MSPFFFGRGLYQTGVCTDSVVKSWLGLCAVGSYLYLGSCLYIHTCIHTCILDLGSFVLGLIVQFVGSLHLDLSVEQHVGSLCV